VSFYLQTAAGLVLAVKAQPGAKRVQIGPVLPAAAALGWPEERLKIAINAPPEDGKANAAIIAALADWLGVKTSAISQTAGATSREKKFLITGPVTMPEL
jgi:uncharacterized protein (TIGR00251 family)